MTVMVVTFGYLADPLTLSITGLWRKSVGQVIVHSAVPPVVILSILDESRHHLQATISPLIITTDCYNKAHSDLCTYWGTV